jgi:hypothetical protein
MGSTLTGPLFMTKFFCDICGAELKASEHTFFAVCNFKQGNITNKLNVKITIGKNNEEGEGDFCLYCIIDAVKDLDDRPTPI